MRQAQKLRTEAGCNFGLRVKAYQTILARRMLCEHARTLADLAIGGRPILVNIGSVSVLRCCEQGNKEVAEGRGAGSSQHVLVGTAGSGRTSDDSVAVSVMAILLVFFPTLRLVAAIPESNRQKGYAALSKYFEVLHFNLQLRYRYVLMAPSMQQDDHVATKISP